MLAQIFAPVSSNMAILGMMDGWVRMDQGGRKAPRLHAMPLRKFRFGISAMPRSLAYSDITRQFAVLYSDPPPMSTPKATIWILSSEQNQVREAHLMEIPHNACGLAPYKDGFLYIESPGTPKAAFAFTDGQEHTSLGHPHLSELLVNTPSPQLLAINENLMLQDAHVSLIADIDLSVGRYTLIRENPIIGIFNGDALRIYRDDKYWVVESTHVASAVSLTYMHEQLPVERVLRLGGVNDRLYVLGSDFKVYRTCIGANNWDVIAG